MTTVYVDNLQNNQEIQSEIQFANYLLNLNSFASFFKTFGRKADSIKAKYISYFNQNNCIAIPKSQVKINFRNKLFLKNPKNILDYLNQFEAFFNFIFIKDANLITLDKEIAVPYFNKKEVVSDMFVILTNNTRLSQYEDIVSGINSNKIQFITTDLSETFRSVIKRQLKKFCEKDKNLKNYTIYYSLGTTAISTKGIQL